MITRLTAAVPLITKGRGEADGVHVAAIGRYSFFEGFEVFGKVGLLMWETDLTLVNFLNQTGAPVRATLSEDGIDPFLAFGAQYRFDKTFSIRGELEYFQVDYRFVEGVDVLNFGVNVVVDF